MKQKTGQKFLENLPIFLHLLEDLFSEKLEDCLKFLVTDLCKSRPSSDSQINLYKRRSENMQRIYRRTTMPKCDLSKEHLWVAASVHVNL